MSISLDDELADAALQAASKAGYTNLVEGLLASGVKASACGGAAVLLADLYGHTEVGNILRAAIQNENAAPSAPPFKPPLPPVKLSIH
jgi:hypothetical protein